MTNPPLLSSCDQIVGDIRNAREALVQVTKRIRSNLYFEKSLEAGGVPLSLGNSTPQNRHDFLSPRRIELDTQLQAMAKSAGRSASSYGKTSPPGYWTGQVSFAPICVAVDICEQGIINCAYLVSCSEDV